MKSKYFDIHSHLNDSRFADDLNEVVSRMRSSNTSTIVVGTDMEMSKRAIELAEEHRDIWATIGLHPTDNHREEFDVSAYEHMAAHPRVVAIGECGLDYYWPAHDGWASGEKEEKLRQRELFEKQIMIAERAHKPLMIHGRPTKGSMDAYEDILEILHAYPSVRGNVHFFVGDTVIAKKFLERGFTMSFTGVLTFSGDYDEVVRFLPLESIMSETDAPYVAPKSVRGKRNEPSFVQETVKCIADIRKQDESTVSEALVENAFRVFHLR